MTNNTTFAPDTPLSVGRQILLAIKKRYDLNPQQKELMFEFGGFGANLNNKNDYLEIITALDGLNDMAGISYTVEDTYTDSSGRSHPYTLFESRICKIKILDSKLFNKATQVVTKKPEDNQTIQYNGLSYNLKSCELLYKNNKPTTVSPTIREMKFLLFLYNHKGEACQFKDIAKAVGTPEYLGNPDLVNRDYTEEVSTLKRDLQKLLRSVKMPLADFNKMIRRVPKYGYKLV